MVLNSIYQRIDADAQFISELTPKELLELFTRLARAQKELQAMNLLTYGEPTEIVKNTTMAPGGLFETSKDFQTLVRKDPEATALFLKLTARVSILRGKADEDREGKTT